MEKPSAAKAYIKPTNPVITDFWAIFCSHSNPVKSLTLNFKKLRKAFTVVLSFFCCENAH
jgi:hypothetical protein